MQTPSQNSVFKISSLLAIVGMLLCLAFPAQAKGKLSPPQAAAKVQQQYGGQVLGIQPLRLNNRDAYRVKLLLPSERVRVFVIDAQSGKPLGGKGKKGKKKRN